MRIGRTLEYRGNQVLSLLGLLGLLSLLGLLGLLRLLRLLGLLRFNPGEYMTIFVTSQLPSPPAF